jgi:putative intracellular protease/amidase
MTTRRDIMLAAAASAALLPASASAQAPQSNGAPPEGLAKPDWNMALVLYPGFTALDLVGPYHFLGGTGAKLHLVTNQTNLEPVPSDIGMAIQPTTTLAECPENLTLLFVPGGTTGTIAAAQDRRTIAFLRHHAQTARYVTSVCTGSLILGAAGLLRGKRATSHWSVVDTLAGFGARPVRERVVRDGNLVTGAGVSAGMDFGVTIVAELLGRSAAEAGVLMAEYAPEPPFATGTLDTAPPELVALLKQGLSGFVEQAQALAG